MGPTIPQDSTSFFDQNLEFVRIHFVHFFLKTDSDFSIGQTQDGKSTLRVVVNKSQLSYLTVSPKLTYMNLEDETAQQM